MSLFPIRRAATLCMTLVMVLSLALIGFGHRLQASPDTSDPAIAAYLASGGELGDICGPLGTGGDAVQGTECPTCLLKSCFALPDLAGAPLRTLTLKARHITLPEPAMIAGRAFDQSRASRAPPRA